MPKSILLSLAFRGKDVAMLGILIMIYFPSTLAADSTFDVAVSEAAAAFQLARESAGLNKFALEFYPFKK